MNASRRVLSSSDGFLLLVLCYVGIPISVNSSFAIECATACVVCASDAFRCSVVIDDSCIDLRG